MHKVYALNAFLQHSDVLVEKRFSGTFSSTIPHSVRLNTVLVLHTSTQQLQLSSLLTAGLGAVPLPLCTGVVARCQH